MTRIKHIDKVEGTWNLDEDEANERRCRGVVAEEDHKLERYCRQRSRQHEILPFGGKWLEGYKSNIENEDWGPRICRATRCGWCPYRPLPLVYSEGDSELVEMVREGGKKGE